MTTTQPATMTFGQLQSTLTQLSAAFASAWSEGAMQYAERVRERELTRIATETEKFEMFRQAMASQFDGLAKQYQTWATAATNAGDGGIGRIMQKWADRFAAQALALSDQVLDARAALDGIVSQANDAIASVDGRLGGALGPVGRAAGPVIDAAQMVAGAFEWATTGNSKAFGEACMGVALAAGLGALVTAGALFFGATLGVAAVVGGVAAGIGSFFAPDAYKWLQNALRKR